MANFGVGNFLLINPVHSFLIGFRFDLRIAHNFLNVFSFNVQSIVPELNELRNFSGFASFSLISFQ
jgi:hypothetical protein